MDANQTWAAQDSPSPLAHLYPSLAYAPWPMARLEGSSHTVKFINSTFCRLVNQPEEQLIGKPFATLIPENPELLALLDQVYRTGQPGSFSERERAERPAVFWSSTMWPVITDERPVGIVLQVTETVPEHMLALNEALALGFVRQHELTDAAERLNAQLRAEIAERKLAEEAARRSEAKFQASETYFRELTQNLPCGVWTSTPDGHVDFINRYWLDYTGHTLEHPIDHPEVSARALHPDDKARIKQLTTAGHATGEAYTFEARFRHASTGEYRWFLKRSVPVRDRNGHVQKRIGISIEIEDLKRAQTLLRHRAGELTSLVEARTAELRETIGEMEAFSYSVSHDLRGPLRALEGYSALLLEKHATTLDAESLRYLTRINSSASRLDSLIRDVLAYSRLVRSQIVLEPVCLDRLTRDIIATYPQLSANGAVIVIKGSLPTVLAHAASLTQCISNLLSNAVKFVPAGTPARVSVYAEDEGDLSRLWIEDNGIGIPPEQHEPIWEIFTRLGSADEYEGTGIGLAIVRKAIERMNGKIGLISAVGKGSRFWLMLRKG